MAVNLQQLKPSLLCVFYTSCYTDSPRVEIITFWQNKSLNTNPVTLSLRLRIVCELLVNTCRFSSGSCSSVWLCYCRPLSTADERQRGLNTCWGSATNDWLKRPRSADSNKRAEQPSDVKERRGAFLCLLAQDMSLMTRRGPLTHHADCLWRVADVTTELTQSCSVLVLHCVSHAAVFFFPFAILIKTGDDDRRKPLVRGNLKVSPFGSSKQQVLGPCCWKLWASFLLAAPPSVSLK